MDASKYPVRTPYGYTGPPYSSSRPHRGNDRKTPKGTPVVITGVEIGKTGNTGSYNGQEYEDHLHTQAGTDQACQNTVKPEAYEFKPGVVVATGTGPQWGKFVTIKVGNHYITYAHLDKINVRVGQEVGGNVFDESELRGNVIRILKMNRRGTSEKQIQTAINIVKTQSSAEWLEGMLRSPWWKEQTAKINAPTAPPVPLKPGTYQVK